MTCLVRGALGVCAWRGGIGLDLLGLSGHGQEDGAKSERAVLNFFDIAKKAEDVGGSFLFLETGVDETDYGAGGFGLEPICWQWRG